MNPNDPRIASGYGEYLVLAGDAKKGLDLLKNAYELDPNGKGASNTDKRLSDIVFGCFVVGNYDECLKYASKVSFLSQIAWISKIASLGALGRTDEKLNEINKFIKFNSNVSIENLIEKIHFKDLNLKKSMRNFIK